jgi:hypothetical protein
MQTYRVTPFLKIIQATTAEPLSAFGIGSAIIRPDNIVVATLEEPFNAIPLFFWPSWSKWSDLEDPSGPMIVETTIDEESALALAAKNPTTREEPYPDNPNLSYQNVETLNFAILIDSGQARSALAIIPFARGSHKIGRRLCGYLSRGLRGKAPIWSNRIEMSTTKLTNRANQSWFALDFGSADPQWIEEQQVPELRNMHDEIKSAYGIGVLNTAPDNE